MAESSNNLSHPAEALLLELRLQRGRAGVGVPLTDAELARRIHVQPRAVVALAYELIVAGCLVAASCDAKAPGRFLLQPGDDLTLAHAYLHSLHERGLKILHRRQAFEAALEAAERQTSPDTHGQLSFALEVDG